MISSSRQVKEERSNMVSPSTVGRVDDGMNGSTASADRNDFSPAGGEGGGGDIILFGFLVLD